MQDPPKLSEEDIIQAMLGNIAGWIVKKFPVDIHEVLFECLNTNARQKLAFDSATGKNSPHCKVFPKDVGVLEIMHRMWGLEGHEVDHFISWPQKAPGYDCIEHEPSKEPD